MKNRFLNVALVAVVVLLFAVVTSQKKSEFIEDKSTTEEQINSKNVLIEKAFPTFKESIRSIKEIILERKDGAITLVKEKDLWRVKEDENFYADKRIINRLIYDISELSQFEKKTKNPDKYGALNLLDLDNKLSRATKVTLKTRDKSFSVLLGKREFKQNGNSHIYFRKIGEEQSWISSNNVMTPMLLPEQWTLDSLDFFDKKSVQKIVFKGFSLKLEKKQWKDSLGESIDNKKVEKLLQNFQKISLTKHTKLFGNPKFEKVVTFTDSMGRVYEIFKTTFGEKDYYKLKSEAAIVKDMYEVWSFELNRKQKSLLEKESDYF